jgi:two-component system chemotaxis response regulator CheB
LTTRVLVVDDASIFRRAISLALAGLPDVEVVGIAANGQLALERLAALRPDVMTLDVEMPLMNGIEVLEAMRKTGIATKAVMLSSCTVRGGKMTLRALEAGAFDFVTKPEGRNPDESIVQMRASLQPIIATLARQREIRAILDNGGTRSVAPPVTHAPALASAARGTALSGPPIVLIGVSTGGPAALAEIVPALPAKLPAPVFIVQHMPPHFTEALAERLESRSAVAVHEARDGEIARNGCVYLAPGGRHMKVCRGERDGIVIRITDDPPEKACRPSVDYLFRSVALNFPGRSVAAILTGMGNDGAEGLRMLKRGGSFNIAQDEASCVVYGMPREAVLTGAVDTVVPLTRIADTITRAVVSRVQA